MIVASAAVVTIATLTATIPGGDLSVDPHITHGGAEMSLGKVRINLAPKAVEIPESAIRFEPAGDQAQVDIPQFRFTFNGLAQPAPAGGNADMAKELGAYVQFLKDTERNRTIALAAENRDLFGRVRALEAELHARPNNADVASLRSAVADEIDAHESLGRSIAMLGDQQVMATEVLATAASRQTLGTDLGAIQLARQIDEQNSKVFNRLFRRQILESNCEAFRKLAGPFPFINREGCQPRSRKNTILFWRASPKPGLFVEIAPPAQAAPMTQASFP
jgi:hypothetical protein